MNIGVITTSYPRWPGDAAGNFVGAHVAAMRALGHEVEVICADANEPLFYRGGAPEALEADGNWLAAVTFTARLTARVMRRAHAWDLAIAHWLAPSALAALPTRVPLLAIAHGGDIHTLRRMRVLPLVLRALQRRGAQLAFVSEQLRSVARDTAPALAPWLGSATIQPMGVELARFAALPRAPSDPPTVLVAARLVPIKGVDVAVAAMPHVRCAAQLVIAGDGPERARLGASPGTHQLLGEVTTLRRDALLQTAGVVVVPSRVTASGRTEGTPMIALEALAAGVPVIASAVGGLRELPHVRLVAPDDPHQLATAIDEVLTHPPAPHVLRAGVAGLDWREVAARLLARMTQRAA